LRIEALSQEFDRLWPEAAAEVEEGADASAAAATLADEVERLEKRSLEELLARYRAQKGRRPARPKKRTLVAYAYERDPLVIAIARMRAAYRCEIDSCAHPIFETAGGAPYTEVHHIIPLSDGGPDTIDNVACLCAAHHREVHFGIVASALTAQLREFRGSEHATLV